ncbi:hypothetical protein T439DRAFT_352451 [Meredithblackwellia eburnea MCA 4105]
MFRRILGASLLLAAFQPTPAFSAVHNPNSIDPAILRPVSISHPARLSSPNNVPAYDIRLHYADEGYTEGPHMASTIQWVMREPTVVLKDDPLISSFTCDDDDVGISLTWASDAAFQQALETWSTPMFAVVEDGDGGCQFGTKKYEALRLDSVLQRDDSSRTITFSKEYYIWQQAATYHHIWAGTAKNAVSLPAPHGLAKRQAITVPASLEFNYNSETKGASRRRIVLLDKTGLVSDTGAVLERAHLYCDNCYAFAKLDLAFSTGSKVADIVIHSSKSPLKAIANFFLNLIPAKRINKELADCKYFSDVAVENYGSYAREEIAKLQKLQSGDPNAKPPILGRRLTTDDFNQLIVKLRVAFLETSHKIENKWSVTHNIPYPAKYQAPYDYSQTLARVYGQTRNALVAEAAKGGLTNLNDKPAVHVSYQSQIVPRSEDSDYDEPLLTRRSESGDPGSDMFELWKPPISQPRVSLTGTPLSDDSNHRALSKRSEDLVRRQSVANGPNMVMKGVIKANVDLHIEFKGKARHELLRKSIWKQDLGGFTIPNIVKAGPHLDLQAIISFVAEGEANFQYGGEVDWDKVNLRFDLKNPTKVPPEQLGEPLKLKRHLYTDKLNGARTELTLGVGVALEPRLVYSLELLISKNVGAHLGVGVRAGVDIVASLGKERLVLPGETAPAKPRSCKHGVELALRSQEIVPIILIGSGSRDNIRSDVLTVYPGADLYAHCYDLSPTLCAANQLFYPFHVPHCLPK